MVEQTLGAVHRRCRVAAVREEEEVPRFDVPFVPPRNCSTRLEWRLSSAQGVRTASYRRRYPTGRTSPAPGRAGIAEIETREKGREEEVFQSGNDGEVAKSPDVERPGWD
jgi:hypothetical protein